MIVADQKYESVGVAFGLGLGLDLGGVGEYCVNVPALAATADVFAVAVEATVKIVQTVKIVEAEKIASAERAAVD